MTNFVGTWRLVRLALHRDRVLLPLWIFGLVGMSVASVRATRELYDTPEAVEAAARGINGSAALVAMYGPIADETSVAAVSVFKLVVVGGLFVSFLTALVVRRHTQLDEESGRAELLAAGALGRSAPLAAALLVAVGAAFAIGFATALGNQLAGNDGLGSLAFGLSWTGIGLVSASVAAVAAQLSSSARTGAGMVATQLGAAYLLRAMGDVSQSWLSWLSPFGWLLKVEAYSGNRWWVLLLSLITALAGTGAAFFLRQRRDLGSGLFAPRPGAQQGGPEFGGVTALYRRLDRTNLALWTVGLALMGALLGSVAPNVDSMVQSPSAQAMIEKLGGVGLLRDTFLAVEISVLGALLSAYAITAMTRFAEDEARGRFDQLLTSGSTRGRAFGAALGQAFVGTAWLALVVGGSLAVAFGLQEGGVGPGLRRLVPAALAQLPAAWVVIAATALVWAWQARRANLAWALLVGFVVLGEFGTLLGLPSWLVDLAPFSHVPRMPVVSFAWPDELALTGLALLGLAAAWGRFSRRDIG
jgi:ABC-2 type transport system permease protein